MRIRKRPASPLLQSLLKEKDEEREPVATIWSQPQAKTSAALERPSMPPRPSGIESGPPPLADERPKATGGAGPRTPWGLDERVDSLPEQRDEQREVEVSADGVTMVEKVPALTTPSDEVDVSEEGWRGAGSESTRPDQRRSDSSSAAQDQFLAGGEASKVVRVSFSLPNEHSELIETLRDRLGNMRIDRNASDLLFAGLKVLSELRDEDLRSLLDETDAADRGRYCQVRWSEDNSTRYLSAVLMSSGDYHILIPRKE